MMAASAPALPSARTQSRGKARPRLRVALLVSAVLVLLVLSAASPAVSTRASLGSESGPSAQKSGVGTSSTNTTRSGAEAPSAATNDTTNSSLFDRRVLETKDALGAAGVSPRDVRLPYVGPPAQVVNGVVVPGYVEAASNVSQTYSGAPAPVGIAYYGENDTNGVIAATTLEATSVVGTLTVHQLESLYDNDLTPDMWGIQLNSVLANVTLGGVGNHEYWVQNAVDYYQHNDTLALGEDTWNFTSPTSIIPNGTSTILSHSPNGTFIGDIYVGEGPWLHAPMPFTLTLYLNSSLTADHEQECWFNYSLFASGDARRSGTFDWLVFNSTNPNHPATVSRALFDADGHHLDPSGLPNDFEFDFGIGPYDGSTLDVLSASADATLGYCPATIVSCTPSQVRPVPAALDFGSETGETSTGLCITYEGTTALATAGPLILRGLWGYPAAAGSSAGAVEVLNAITVTGSPDPTSTVPYVFVFFNGSSFIRPRFDWAPDVPAWYLEPGTYEVEVMLADYAEWSGTIVVGTTPVTLSIPLPYQPSSGVYTPLWAFGNPELSGISTSGNGTLSDPYRLFNNPTAACTACGNALDANLSTRFFSLNDFDFPTFTGIWLVSTDAHVDIDHPVSFCVLGFSYGTKSDPKQGPYLYLQIGLVSTHSVTLSNDTESGGWPAMAEIVTLAGVVDAAENTAPQANVMIWNSTNDLVMSNTFVPSWLVPPYQTQCIGVCPAVSCSWCVSPDGLLLYGGTNNTVWGNTFRDAATPPGAPGQAYAGLAEAESGDLIFNNNFSVDNPTVYLPFDIYNDSCPDSDVGDCQPLHPPMYADTWNVPAQPARDVAATVNGVPLSGNVLGPDCPTQGGNYWNNFGNALNPNSTLPYVNAYIYWELHLILPQPSTGIHDSIQVGGDHAPLVLSSVCHAPSPPSPPGPPILEYAAIGGGLTVGVLSAGIVIVRPLLRSRPAPWLAPPRGSAAASSQGEGFVAGSVAVAAEWLEELRSPRFRERWARRPLGASLWAGIAILAGYLAVAMSALIVFRNSLYAVPINPTWIPPFNPIGPSYAHPFGVLPGLGTDLFRALWQATPFDLAIVGGILVIDAGLGWVLGGIAGMNEGGVVDSVVMFLSDTLGAIPSFFLVVALFAGLWTVAPASVNLPVFVLLFGLVIWPTTARTTRERARQVAREPYLESARASGAGRTYLFFRHILPNSLSPVLAQLPIDVAPIFFVLTIFPWFWDCAGPGGSKGLYYLIASLPPYSPLPAVNFPEYGNLLAIGTCEGLPISTVGSAGWWMVLFPLLAILFLGIGIALVCDGIDRRLNSRHV